MREVLEKKKENLVLGLRNWKHGLGTGSQNNMVLEGRDPTVGLVRFRIEARIRSVSADASTLFVTRFICTRKCTRY